MYGPETPEYLSGNMIEKCIDTAQKMNFSFNDFFNKCEQIRSFLRIWSHLMKKSLVKNFTFCAADVLISSKVKNTKMTSFSLLLQLALKEFICSEFYV